MSGEYGTATLTVNDEHWPRRRLFQLFPSLHGGMHMHVDLADDMG